jgi:hypothetical protein
MIPYMVCNVTFFERSPKKGVSGVSLRRTPNPPFFGYFFEFDIVMIVMYSGREAATLATSLQLRG